MKGGRTPIHIMRWAPADYEGDEAVKLAVRRRNYRALAFYMAFINHSFMAGGDLPDDCERLAVTLGWSRGEVALAVRYWRAEGKLESVNGRLVQKRVQRDVAQELEYRELQSERGRLGGRPKKAVAKPALVDVKSPPAPAPAPAPVGRKEPADLPPARPPEQRAEEATDATIRRLQLELGSWIARLAEHPNSRQMVPAWSREVTSYTRGDGTKVRGVPDYRTVNSIDRLERSLEDAQWWWEELESGKVIGEVVSHGTR